MSEMEKPKIEMPQYLCHKKVWALKIKRIQEHTEHISTLHFEDERYAPIDVDIDYLRKHEPEPGGYYVVYADGYNSYSPAKAFEEGYALITDEPDSSKDELSASEALYSFVSWLTGRKELVAFGASLNAAPAAQLVSAFIKVNKLPETRPDWHKRIIPMPEINNAGEVITAEDVEGTHQK